jgi:hypothetical protein
MALSIDLHQQTQLTSSLINAHLALKQQQQQQQAISNNSISTTIGTCPLQVLLASKQHQQEATAMAEHANLGHYLRLTCELGTQLHQLQKWLLSR